MSLFRKSLPFFSKSYLGSALQTICPDQDFTVWSGRRHSVLPSVRSVTILTERINDPSGFRLNQRLQYGRRDMSV